MFKVTNKQIKKNFTPKEVPSTFSVQKKGSKVFNWLLKLALKYKLISKYYENSVSYKTVGIKYSSIEEAVCKILREMDEQRLPRPVALIMGSEQLKELKAECSMNDIFAVRMPSPEYSPYTFRGLTVVINPYIDGVVPISESMFKACELGSPYDQYRISWRESSPPLRPFDPDAGFDFSPPMR